MDSNIVINVSLQKEEAGDFKALLHKSKVKLSGRQLLMLTVTIILMVIILIYATFFRKNPAGMAETSQTNTTVTIWPFLLLFLLIIYRLAAPLWIKSKEMKEFAGNKYLMKEAEYIFARDGIRAYSDQKSLNLHWVEIIKVVETKKYLAIYDSSLEYALIPKRCFAQEDTLEAVIDLFKTSLPETKYELLNEL